MGHGLQDGIVKLDGPWDQQGVVGGLRRHDAALLGGEVWLGDGGEGPVDGFILDVVGFERLSLGRERRVQLGQRQTLVEVSGDERQAGICAAPPRAAA